MLNLYSDLPLIFYLQIKLLKTTRYEKSVHQISPVLITLILINVVIGTYMSSQAVLNFVLYKFGHLPQREWQIMHDLAKMFLHCVNHWKLETPTAKKQHSQGEDLAAYKMNYTRSVYCKKIFILLNMLVKVELTL